MFVVPVRTHEQKFTGGTVCACYHCGEFFGSANGTCANLCKNCRTAEQRASMDAENAEVWDKSGLVFHCAYCEAMKAIRNKDAQPVEAQG